MSVINVSSVSALGTALKTAHAGDTIALAAGTYSGVSISGANFSSAVTITSADHSHPAVLAGLKVSQSSGLTFQNLKMTSAGAADPWYAFRVAGDHNIHFDHLDVYGNLANAPGTQLNGFLVSGSSNIVFTNSEFQDLNSAIVANNNNSITINNNAFEDMSKGGIEAGGDSGLTIQNNNFSGFHTASGVHGDAIQVYTTSADPTQDLVITGNLFDRAGGDPAQGIFIQQQAGNAPIHNVTVDDNTILGGQWNSIYLSGVSGTVQLENNTVESWAGNDVVAGHTTNFVGWIRFDGNNSGITSLTETGNLAQSYIAATGKAVAPPAGNSLISGAVTDNGQAMFQAWAHENPVAVPSLAPDLLSQLQGLHVASTVGIV